MRKTALQKLTTGLSASLESPKSGVATFGRAVEGKCQLKKTNAQVGRLFLPVSGVSSRNLLQVSPFLPQPCFQVFSRIPQNHRRQFYPYLILPIILFMKDVDDVWLYGDSRRYNRFVIRTRNFPCGKASAEYPGTDFDN